jgi:xylulose-5-phosphate/fructose-6-phosphate phosphoketolase
MALDNPDLIVACVVGDGEAETGPLATAWHSNKFLNPVRDGAVLPILNLNGYKIANPTILARISHEELEALFVGYGYTPYFVEGSDPATMHQQMAATLDGRSRDPRIQQGARERTTAAPRWPMIVLRSPKGWTGRRRSRATRSRVVALAPGAVLRRARQPGEPAAARDWMRSYRPRSCSTRRHARARAQALAPRGPPHERQPARQRRRCCARSSSCPTSATTP